MQKTIAVDRTNYSFEVFTGRVVGSNKYTTTSVSSSGGAVSTNPQGYVSSSPVSVTSTTTVHDELFLVNKEGAERSFHLTGFGVACREGHTLSVISMFREGEDSGCFVAVYNHTTSSPFTWNKSDFKKIVVNTGCAWVIALPVVNILYDHYVAHTTDALANSLFVFCATMLVWLWYNNRRVTKVFNAASAELTSIFSELQALPQME